MKRKNIFFYCIILMVFCQVLQGSYGVLAISDGQKSAIIDSCGKIKDDLKKVQKDDSRARVYLGGYYEGVLSNYIMPLNVKLVEANMSSVGLVENQSNFVSARAAFSDDFVKYQKGLEELLMMDCKSEPDKFYEKLESVRRKRKTVEQDVVKIRGLVSEQIKMVNGLMEKMR